jgi:hypothetical protein
MILDKIKAKFKKYTNPYYKQIKSVLCPSDDEILEIAEYIEHNKEKIKPYFGTINGPIDKFTLDRIVESIGKFSYLMESSIRLRTVSQYFDILEDLSNKIEKIRMGDFNSLPKYDNVAKPKKYYIEFAFDIDGNPEKRKETLINILEHLIADAVLAGLPISYYDETDNSPIQYYMEFYPDRTRIRIFVNKSIHPHDVAFYLLYKLNHIKGKEFIIPPSGNEKYYIIKNKKAGIINRIGIDRNPNKDVYVSEVLWYYRRSYFLG